MAKKNEYVRSVKTKRQEVNGRFVPGLLMPLLIVVALGAIGYISLVTRNESLGRVITDLEAKEKDVLQHVGNEESNWENAKSLANIRGLLQRNHINMELPRGNSVVHILRPTEGPGAAHKMPGTDIAKGGENASHE